MSGDLTMTTRLAVEAVLAHRLSTEPGFLERLTLDVGPIIRTILREVAPEANDHLSPETTFHVHVESEHQVHFVVRGGKRIGTGPPSIFDLLEAGCAVPTIDEYGCVV